LVVFKYLAKKVMMFGAIVEKQVLLGTIFPNNIDFPSIVMTKTVSGKREKVF